MVSDLRLHIHIPPAPPLPAASSPTRDRASPLPQFQRPRAMVALLPNSPVPHRCACQAGKKLEVPPAGAVLWVCRTQLPPSAGYCEAEQNEERLNTLCLPLISSSHQLSVGTQDLCILCPSLQTGSNRMSSKLSKGSGKETQMQTDSAITEVSFL